MIELKICAVENSMHKSLLQNKKCCSYFGTPDSNSIKIPFLRRHNDTNSSIILIYTESCTYQKKI